MAIQIEFPWLTFLSSHFAFHSRTAVSVEEVFWVFNSIVKQRVMLKFVFLLSKLEFPPELFLSYDPMHAKAFSFAVTIPVLRSGIHFYHQCLKLNKSVNPVSCPSIQNGGPAKVQNKNDVDFRDKRNYRRENKKRVFGLMKTFGGKNKKRKNEEES